MAIRSVSHTLESIETGRKFPVGSFADQYKESFKEQEEADRSRKHLDILSNQNDLLRRQNKIYFWILLATIVGLVITIVGLIITIIVS